MDKPYLHNDDIAIPYQKFVLDQIHSWFLMINCAK
jgi:hypothetical protein